MAVTAILHGGLGNQLFQYFYATLLTDARHANSLQLVTARLGHYVVERDMELEPLLAVSDIVAVRDRMSPLERCRVPKLLQRLTGKEGPLRLGGRHVLVDGYFQQWSAYDRFAASAIASLLDRWRGVLREGNLLVAPTLPPLTHIRLTDFVAAGRDPRDLAGPAVAAVPADGSIMTDDEATIGSLLAARADGDRPRLVPTGGLSSWDVFRAMSQFRTIHTNGSSLACWAAVLAGARLVSTNADHAAFARRCARSIDDGART